MVPSTVLLDKLGNGVFRSHLLMAHGNGASVMFVKRWKALENRDGGKRATLGSHSDG